MRFQRDGHYCSMWFGENDPTFTYMRFGATSTYSVTTEKMATAGGGFLRVLRDPSNHEVIGIEIEPHEETPEYHDGRQGGACPPRG